MNKRYEKMSTTHLIYFNYFREKKIDWKKVSWEGGLNPAECKRYWNYVQDRIRRFRIMAELVPDARHWIGN